jgi:ribosomal subunit interface protein
MEIIVRGRHLAVPSRFRQHAAAKLARLEKLDHKVEQIDVEVSEERNPRQSDRRERVELTIRSRGPAIRAEAAADDRYTALDMALAKLESRLRRAGDRRKTRHTEGASLRSPGLGSPGPGSPGLGSPGPGSPGLGAASPGPSALAADGVPAAALGGLDGPAANGTRIAHPRTGELDDPAADVDDQPGPGPRMIPIEMEGDGPVVLREKVHAATPMTIDQALLEMELVGHDFYLFHDSECDRFSVVYRRRGYDYGVIRLVEE